MKKILNAMLMVMLMVFVSNALDKATLPHTIDTASTPKVVYVDDNDQELRDVINATIDTLIALRDSTDNDAVLLAESLSVHRDTLNAHSDSITNLRSDITTAESNVQLATDSNGVTKSLIAGVSAYDISNGVANVILGITNVNANHSAVGGNVFVGTGIGAVGTNGINSNTIVGYEAGYRLGESDTANYNIAMGFQPLYTTDGSFNIALGYQSGYDTGDSNIYLGGGTKTSTPESQIFRLEVNQGSFTTPLLYGNFASDSLAVNGDFTATGTIRTDSIIAETTNLNIEASGQMNVYTPTAFNEAVSITNNAILYLDTMKTAGGTGVIVDDNFRVTDTIITDFIDDRSGGQIAFNSDMKISGDIVRDVLTDRFDMCGGTSISVSHGGSVRIEGNNFGGTGLGGDVQIYSGNTTNGNVNILTGPTSASACEFLSDQTTKINGKLRITNSSSPASSDACNSGTITWDANYIYVCTSSGAWKRSALTGGY